MVRPQLWDLDAIAAFLTVIFWLALPIPSFSQFTPPCEAADMDASIQTADGPESYYTLALNYRNISGHECRLMYPDPPGFVPRPAPKGAPQDARFDACMDCANRSPDGKPVYVPPVTIENGGVVNIAVKWRTEPADGRAECWQPALMDTSINQDYQNEYQVVSGALLKRVCSTIEVGRYVRGVFDARSQPATGVTAGATIELIPDANTYYPGQRIRIAATVHPPAADSSAKERFCPVMLERIRSPGGGTRWDEIGNWCEAETIGTDASGRHIKIEFDSGHNSRWSGLGDHAISMFLLAKSGDRGSVLSPESNTVDVNIADNKTMKREWGRQVRGVAVGVTLDRKRYELGQDVPLHIGLENFAAEQPVLTFNPNWDACCVYEVLVRDACEHPVKKSQVIWIGHHGGPLMPYSKGKIVPIESALSEQGQLPKTPGRYSVTVTWSPWTYADDSCDHCERIWGPRKVTQYAVAHDTETFEVFDKDHPQEGFITGPLKAACADAGRPGFEQVATSFGPYTALLDKATGLKWLHLDLTASRSYPDVKKNLEPGGLFAGWRYATPDELRRLFADFSALPGRNLTGAALVSKLRKALGGGWNRSPDGFVEEVSGGDHATYGYAAEDTASAPAVRPHLLGYVPSDWATDSLGSFLVQTDNLPPNDLSTTKPRE